MEEEAVTTDRLPLDKQAIAALEALGFSISDEKFAARIGGAVVCVRRLANLRQPEFEVEITLPGGGLLTCFARRRQLFDPVEVP